MTHTKLIITGDLFPMPCNYGAFSSGDIQTLFGKKLCELFAGADVRICNFEGCFTDNDTPIEKAGPNIKAPISTLAAIKKLGIDYATLGNTHSMDYGTQGFSDTCRALDENGIGWFGWGKNAASVRNSVTFTHQSRKITLYNTTEQFENKPTPDRAGVNLYDEYRVCEEVKALKQNCDMLIVLYHGGIENSHYHSDIMRTRFHRMADSGADVVISQHTHAVGSQEYYKNAYLLYGQGNFCFHFRKDVTPLLAEGLVLELDITDNGFTASPHRILRTELGCAYDEKQELSAFYERSRMNEMLISGDKAASCAFNKAYDSDIQQWARLFFYAFRGKNPADDECKKTLDENEYVHYLKRSYTKQQILAMQMFLRNEEFHEIGSRLIENLLKEYETEDLSK